MILKSPILNAQLWSEFLVDRIPCNLKQEESAKPCDGIINQATVPENYQIVFRINTVSSLEFGEECLNTICGDRTSRHLIAE